MALTINYTLDSSVTALNTAGSATYNPTLYTQFTGAVAAAVNFFETAITNPITVNISFGWGTVGGSPVDAGAVAESSSYFNTFTYAQVLSAMKATDTTSGVQQAAIASLPANDPTSGAQFQVNYAEELALGMTGGSATSATLDGSVGLSSQLGSFGQSFTWVGGTYTAASFDAVGALEHEISEVLGRIDDGGSGGAYTPLDLFRYTAADGKSTDAIGAAAGARDQPFVNGYNANAPSYFSYNGTTVTKLYETPADVSNGADIADWAPSVGHDAFGDGPSGAADPVSQTDLQELNVLGYDLVDATPPVVTAGSATVAQIFRQGVTTTPVLVDAGASVSDPASSTLISALVSIGAGFRANADVLAADTAGTPSISQSYNASTGVLTLSGTDTLAHYQAVLTSITFSTSTPSAPSTRTVTTTVSDIMGSSAPVTTTIYVAPIETLGPGNTVAYLNGTSATITTASGVVDAYGNDFGDSISASGDANPILLEGGSGNDTLTTGTGGGWLYGQGGTNVLYGGGAAGASDHFVGGSGGSNAMYGGSGTNIFQVTGSDAVHGAGTFNYVDPLVTGVTLSLGGNAIQEVDLLGGNNSVDMTGATGPTYLYGASGNDTLTTGSGGGLLSGGGGSNTLTGGAAAGASDVFFGGNGGSNAMFGGNGNNVFHVTGNDTVNGAGTFNYVQTLVTGVTLSLGTSNIQEVDLETGGNTVDMTGASYPTFVYSLTGNNTMTSGSGGGDLFGGPGISTLTSGGAAGTTSVFVGGNGGSNAMFGGGGVNVFDITGNDTVHGAGTFNYIEPLAGGLTLSLGGSDIQEVDLQSGNNIVDMTGAATATYLYGGSGNDSLTTGAGGGYLFGEGGTNTLQGGGAAGATDHFVGGNGGSNQMYGGHGTNVFDVTGTDTVHGAGTFNYVVALTGGLNLSLGTSGIQEVDLLSGSNKVDMTGSATANYLHAGSGNDSLTTGAGGGYLFGGAGNSTLTGGGAAGATDRFYGGSGSNQMYGGNGTNKFFTTGNDTVHGNGGANYDILLANSVTLSLGTSDIQQVYLLGGNNSVNMAGATSSTYLYGAAGNDTLQGGTGNDYLWGGAGTNSFVEAQGWGKDTIEDWSAGANNVIDLTALAAQGVHNLGGVSQAVVGGSDVIGFGGNTLTVHGVGSLLTASSFKFA